MQDEAQRNYAEYKRRYMDTTNSAALKYMHDVSRGAPSDVSQILASGTRQPDVASLLARGSEILAPKPQPDEDARRQLINNLLKNKNYSTTTPAAAAVTPVRAPTTSAKELLQTAADSMVPSQSQPPKPPKQSFTDPSADLFPPDLELPSDERLVEKQLVWDSVGLLIGAKRGRYIQLMIDAPKQADALPSVQLRIFPKIPMYIQALAARVCGELPQRRENVQAVVQALAKKQSPIDQRLGVILARMLADMSAQAEPLKACIGLQELDCRLSTVRIAYDALNDFTSKALESGALRAACVSSQSPVLKPVVEEILNFYLSKFLGPWLHGGVYSPELLCIEKVESRPFHESFRFKPGVLELMDPVGNELVVVGRNIHFFGLAQKEGAATTTKTAKQTLITRDFFGAQTPEKAFDLLRQRLHPDHPQTFYGFIQALARESQAGALRAVGPAELQRFLRKVSQYVLLQRADFATAFLETARAEMAEPAGTVRLTRLENQFQYALQTTGCAKDVQLKVSDVQYMQLYDYVQGKKEAFAQPAVDKNMIKTINLIAVTLPFPPLIALLFEEATQRKLELLNRRLLRQKAVEADLLYSQQALQRAKTITSTSMKVICRVVAHMTGFLRAAELQTQMVIIATLDQLQQRIFESDSVDGVKKAIDGAVDRLIESLIGPIEKLQLMDKCCAEIKVFSRFVEQKFITVFTGLPENISDTQRTEILTQRIEEIIANDLAILKGVDDQFVAKTRAWDAMHQ